MNFRYISIFSQTAEFLLTKELPFRLKSLGYTNLVSGKTFLYAQGTLPVMLVAHVDTVHAVKTPEVFYDKMRGWLWSPDGIGGDDRAGIASILEILRNGYRPHLLFPDLEEKGGTGTKDAVKELTKPDIRYIIELDRKGSVDSVFYELTSPRFERYVNYFGFKTDHGTFTDICTLCPAWGVAGVNLSIGYYDAHQKTEHVKLNEWQTTTNKVMRMLDRIPCKAFPFVKKAPVVTTYGGVKSYGNVNSNYNYNYNDYDDYGYYGEGASYVTRPNAGNKYGFQDADLERLDRINKKLGEAIAINKKSKKNKKKEVKTKGEESPKLLTCSTTEEPKLPEPELRFAEGYEEEELEEQVFSEARSDSYSEDGESEEEFYERDLDVVIDPVEMVQIYGGSPESWAEWIDNNIEELSKIANNAASAAIEDEIDRRFNEIMSNVIKRG